MKVRCFVTSFRHAGALQCLPIRPALSFSRCYSPGLQHLSRSYSSPTDQILQDAAPSKLTKPQSRQWLSDVKKRIGKCILFGLRPDQVQRAAEVLRVIARDWKKLVAGSEGFLTGKNMAGLIQHGITWGEMDSMGHVNNVAYTRYAESARVNWVRNFATHIDPQHKKEWLEALTSKGDGLILRSIKTVYKIPLTWPDKVSVYHKIRHLPLSSGDSFLLDVVIMSERHQRIAATCEEDIVIYDYREGKKTTLKPFMVDALRKIYILQEQTESNSARQISDILNRVEALEKESWDRRDAQEDLGSAS